LNDQRFTENQASQRATASEGAPLMAKEPELVQPKIKGESTDKEHKDWLIQ
jgi:hypothetical protein